MVPLLIAILFLSSNLAFAFRTDYCQDCERDSRGKIERSHRALQQFKIQTGFRHGRPGYHVDHIVPLACGGADTPENMQWLSIEMKRVKDRTERRECYAR